MRRSNYAVGLTASVLVHAAVIVVLRTRAGPSPAPAPVPPVVVASVDLAAVEPEEVVLDAPPVPLLEAAPEPLPEPLPVPARAAPAAPPAPPPVAPAVRTAGAPGPAPPETDPAPDESPPLPPTVERASPSPPAPSRVVEPLPSPSPSPEPATAAPPAVAADAPALTPDPAPASRRRGQGGTVVVPSLRVHWRNAAEVLAVARTMGMRLAAVDRDGVVIGEVDLAGAPSLRRWAGLPAGYSSRVRMLSPSIFSARLGGEREADVHEIWLFVPVDRDRAMIEAQRAAVRRAGTRPEDVRAMDGRFVRAADGTYRLEVTGLRPTVPQGARDE